MLIEAFICVFLGTKKFRKRKSFSTWPRTRSASSSISIGRMLSGWNRFWWCQEKSPKIRNRALCGPFSTATSTANNCQLNLSHYFRLRVLSLQLPTFVELEIIHFLNSLPQMNWNVVKLKLFASQVQNCGQASGHLGAEARRDQVLQDQRREVPLPHRPPQDQVQSLPVALNKWGWFLTVGCFVKAHVCFTIVFA